MKGWRIHKALITLVLTLTLAASLSGCKYNSFDEYLEALGMKDAEDSAVESSSGASVIVSEDSTTSEQGASVVSSIDSSNAASSENSDDAAAQDTSKEKRADSDFESYYQSSDSLASDEEMQKQRAAIGLTDTGIASIKEKQKGLYCYERLTESGKTLYVEILTIMQNLGKDILVSTTSDEAVELVFDYVCADHPEIFYVDGYQYTNYTVDGVITKISFSGNYIYDKDEIARRETLINEYVNKCLEGAPNSEDDYYAIKYVYEYIIENTEYDVNAADNQNICSVFMTGKSVCNGYAKATQYLLNKLGIPCTLCVGTVNTKTSKGVRHAWNLVLCNNVYYYVDTTWGDSSYQTSSGESADATKLPKVNYDYLNVTSAEITQNHTFSDVLDVPVCTNTTDNYYVREDEYFTSAELSLVGDLFKRRYADGSDNVTIKCASKEVYDSIFEELITNRKVFDYLQGDNSVVSYTTFADTKTIIIWLK
ncbi:transglutaminase domain-containing protein [Butyrivibrio proteoclasticus]|uniref:transglutaminase domain-containing protein n=1 Tax=Butyrivibrio proteoclasticus TaxID=43305 RepID=UPI0012DF3AA2|nr:transglutaminase domain-containing protein [Butyrivibrio proteoclasticus]